MKTFTKTIEVFKSTSTGRGYIETTRLVCRAKSPKGIATAKKWTVKTREGWNDISVTEGEAGLKVVDRPWVAG